MADKETTELVLHGTWSAFEDRGDWRQFEIKVEGKQYPYKLSTKNPEVIEAMMAARDQEATFYGAEQESDKINEHTSKPYMNRYLNDVKLGTEGQAQLPGTGSETYPRGYPTRRDWIRQWDDVRAVGPEGAPAVHELRVGTHAHRPEPDVPLRRGSGRSVHPPSEIPAEDLRRHVRGVRVPGEWVRSSGRAAPRSGRGTSGADREGRRHPLSSRAVAARSGVVGCCNSRPLEKTRGRRSTRPLSLFRSHLDGAILGTPHVENGHSLADSPADIAQESRAGVLLQRGPGKHWVQDTKPGGSLRKRQRSARATAPTPQRVRQRGSRS